MKGSIIAENHGAWNAALEAFGVDRLPEGGGRVEPWEPLEAALNAAAPHLCRSLLERVEELEGALRFYAKQRGLGSVLASDGGKVARVALAASDSVGSTPNG